MSHNTQPGIVYLYTCFTAESSEGAKNLFCYTNLMEVLWAWIILGLGGYIVYRRYSKDGDWRKYSRKQIIILIMMVDLIAYISYEWSYESPLLYFPESYLQYIFFCFTIYYFGRKSILLGMLNMRLDLADQDIDPIIQLKLSKLFCIGLCSFFTIIYVMTYVQYFVQVNRYAKYDFCNALAEFFNIVTTVGFFMQGLFILQVKQLSRQVEKNLKVQELDSQMQEVKKTIENRQKQLWLLVICCFIGSFTTFVQNIYFVSMNAKYEDDPGYYQCWYFKIPSKPVLSEDLNALINTLIKFVAFFLPYFLTVNIFWYREPPLENTRDDDQFEDYVINFGPQPPQSKEASLELN